MKTHSSLTQGAIFRGGQSLFLLAAALFWSISPCARAQSTPQVVTIAGSPGIAGALDETGSNAQFSSPSDIVTDAGGNVFVADSDNNTIRKITPGGKVTTLAGNPDEAAGYVDGPGSDARFWYPSGICIDKNGNLYVSDCNNNTIRKITLAGEVTTLAGGPDPGSADGTGVDAQFSSPSGIAVDAGGNVYVADYWNNTIRKITPGGKVTTLAGNPDAAGNADGTGSDALFNSPSDVALDASGNVYVADSSNNAIRKITPQGEVTTFAGNPGLDAGSADGKGSDALFNYPTGVALDATGNVYVADSWNNSIRKITPGGEVTTVAGNPEEVSGSADGAGIDARFNAPSGLALDASGGIYVADWGNSTIRRISLPNVHLDPAGGTVTPEDMTVILGSAYGPMPIPERSGYSFEGWWTGGTGILVTETGIVTNASFHILHAKWTPNSYTVTAIASPVEGGSVEGGGSYKTDQTVTLNAKAKTGYTFKAWDDGSQLVSRNITVSGSNVDVTAYFKKTIDIEPPTIVGLDDQNAMVGMSFRLALEIASESAPKVTVTGLPAGLKYDPVTQIISGTPTKQTKTGVPAIIKISVSNAGNPGAPTTTTIAITVNPLPTWAVGVFNGENSMGYVTHPGDPDASAETAPTPVTMTVTAKGRVTGRFVESGTGYAFTGGYAREDEDGAFWISAQAVAGRTSRLLTFRVSPMDQPDNGAQFLAKAEGSWGAGDSLLEEAGSLQMYRNIWKDADMKEALAGLKGYYTATLPGEDGQGSGYLTFTVDAAGNVKTAGKLADGTVIAMSSPLIIDELGAVWTVTYAAPVAYKGGGFSGWTFFNNPGDGSPTTLDGSFTWENINPQATENYGEGFLRWPVVSGGLYNKTDNLHDRYDGLLTVGDIPSLPGATVMVRFTTFDVDDNGNDFKYSWVEPTLVDPASESPGGSEITVTTGQGLSAPRAHTPKKDPDTGDYDYSLENSSGLTISLNRATGIFKGSFNVYYDYESVVDDTNPDRPPTSAHLSKKMSFEGVLTPVRGASDGGGVEGRGFFLADQKAPYNPDTGEGGSYSFKQSFDFSLQY